MYLSVKLGLNSKTRRRMVCKHFLTKLAKKISDNVKFYDLKDKFVTTKS